jgi:hypothetical protein
MKTLPCWRCAHLFRAGLGPCEIHEYPYSKGWWSDFRLGLACFAVAELAWKFL